MNPHARQIAPNSALVAVLMLAFGWVYGLSGASESALYNLTVEAFNWMLRVGGLAMAVVAGLCFMGRRAGLLLDFIVSGACAAVMLVCGVYWLGRWAADTKNVPFDLQDVLILVFGAVFARAALQSWSLYGAARPSTPEGPDVGEAAAPHPASVHPSGLPNAGEADPPGGYLSALSKEKGEPPGASYE
jgi:hypothetical protein